MVVVEVVQPVVTVYTLGTTGRADVSAVNLMIISLIEMACVILEPLTSGLIAVRSTWMMRQTTLSAHTSSKVPKGFASS